MQRFKQNFLLLVCAILFVMGFIYSYTTTDALGNKFFTSLALLSLIGMCWTPGINNNKKQNSYDKD